MKTLSRILFSILLSTGLLFSWFTAEAVVTIDSTPIPHSVLPRNGVRIPFLEVNVTTQGEAVRIKSFTVRKTGLSSNQDIESVRISAGYKTSYRASVDNDDLATLRFFRGYYIAPYRTETFVLYANLNVQGSNRTIGFELLDIESENGSLYNETVRPSKPRISYRNPSRYYYPQYRTRTNRRSNTTSRTSSYEVPRVEFKPNGSAGRIYIGRDNRLGRFRLKNPSRKRMSIGHLRFRNIGSADLSDMFDTLKLKDNRGWTVATSTRIHKNRRTQTQLASS